MVSKPGYNLCLICQSTFLSTHSLRHIRLSRCKALLISRIISHAHSRQLSLSLIVLRPVSLSRSPKRHLELCSLGSLDAAMTGHLQVIVQPRGARVTPSAEWSHPGGEPARASCILVRARAYLCSICLTCSSSSRCRMRRKFFNSGMEKACHCKWGGERHCISACKVHKPCLLDETHCLDPLL